MSGLRHISDIYREARALEQLPVVDPLNPDGFEIDALGVSLYWGGYLYFIEADRIDTSEKALGWIAHVGEKGWEGAKAERISNLIRVLGEKYGWRLEGM